MSAKIEKPPIILSYKYFNINVNEVSSLDKQVYLSHTNMTTCFVKITYNNYCCPPLPHVPKRYGTYSNA